MLKFVKLLDFSKATSPLLLSIPLRLGKTVLVPLKWKFLNLFYDILMKAPPILNTDFLYYFLAQKAEAAEEQKKRFKLYVR